MLNFIIEVGPLVAFFIGYKSGDIMNATLYMLFATIAGLFVSYLKYKTVNKVTLFSAILLLFSASLTLFSGNSIFIKMKPTIFYLIFAGAFLITNFRRSSPAIKYALGKAIKFQDDKNWRVLNLRFMWYFLFMAFINEIVWRNFSEETWVNFKVFGAMPLTILFVLLQMPFIMKHSEKKTAR